MIVNKDSYFVVLELTDMATACAKVNYIFKQARDNASIIPCVDLRGSTANANNTLKFDNSYNLKGWRYATADEIALYDLHKKPCFIGDIPEKKQEYDYLVDIFKRYNIT